MNLLTALTTLSFLTISITALPIPIRTRQLPPLDPAAELTLLDTIMPGNGIPKAVQGLEGDLAKQKLSS
ncbi:hypothetical protein BDV18DRAFT_133931 [Aspergillus unguis]